MFSLHRKEVKEAAERERNAEFERKKRKMTVVRMTSSHALSLRSGYDDDDDDDV